MSYSSPCRPEETPPGSRFLHTSGSVSIFSFSPRCPCTGVLSINLQRNICGCLLLSPYFFLPGMIQSSAHRAYTTWPRVSPGPRCFAAVWGTAGGRQTTGRPQLPGDGRRSCKLFQSHKRVGPTTFCALWAHYFVKKNKD